MKCFFALFNVFLGSSDRDDLMETLDGGILGMNGHVSHRIYEKQTFHHHHGNQYLRYRVKLPKIDHIAFSNVLVAFCDSYR